MSKKPLVVLGLLGTTLDAGAGANRWNRWRPIVSLCQHDSLLVSRMELLHDPRFVELAESVKKDLHDVSPDTDVRLRAFTVKDPWDFEEVYGALHEFARTYPFDPDREDYLVHINMRLSPEHRELLEQAAAAAGQDLTSFALEACLMRAEEVLYRHQSTTLTRRDMKRFLKLLDKPPAPTAALKAAFRRLKDFRE